MLRLLAIACLAVSFCTCADPKVYRKEGDFIIAAILPLTTSDGGQKCSTPNVLEVAHAEAIAYAVTELNREPSTSVGYDIRDSCSDVITERNLANQMNAEKLAHAQDPQNKKPVDAVVGAFQEKDLAVMEYLNIENILQYSNDPNNARLKQNSNVPKESIRGLVSAYPIGTSRILAIADVIKEFGFQSVYAVVSDDYQGDSGYQLLKKRLSEIKTCTSDELFLSRANGINATVEKIKSNRLIQVIVVHADEAAELDLYHKLSNSSLDDLVILTTRDWGTDLDKLTAFSGLAEGMIYIGASKDTKFKEYMSSLVRQKLAERPWIKTLYKASCISEPLSKSQECSDNEKEVSESLAEAAPKAIFSIDAAFSAYLANKAVKEGTAKSELAAIKDLKVRVLGLDDADDLYAIKYDDNLSATRSKFNVYNVQLKQAKLESEYIGKWNDDTNLHIAKKQVVWKGQSKETPVSACSPACVAGEKRVFPKGEEQCCWTCEKCPAGTATNVINADECEACLGELVANPNGTECVRYKVRYFSFATAMGNVIIFLFVVGVALVLFALAIFTQNKDHLIIATIPYRLLLIYLFGLLLMFVGCAPLLLRPNVTVCSLYIALFNIGLSICFSVLMARSDYINNYYDDEGNVVKSGCCGNPRMFCICLVVFIQILIVGIGLNVEPPQTLYNLTEKWDMRWFECSSWLSYVWWVSLGYNIGLSVVGNSLSCTSTKMQEHGGDLKYVAITYLVFYLVGLFEIVIFYQYVDRELEEAQAVMAFLIAFFLYLTYIVPKIYQVQFHKEKKKGGSDALLGEEGAGEEEHHHHHTAIHSADAFRHHGVVQVKLKE